jgi:transcriptional regulator with GAF, ATPase, and Fis domain
MASNEVLNIEYHRLRLVLKALNNCNTQAQAAQQLGVSLRTLDLDIKRYSIQYKSKKYTLLKL